MNFHDTKMGHTFFEHQLPQLIEAIQVLTAALDRPAQTVTLPVEADPEFLSSLYYGDYEPDFFKQSPRGHELTHNINVSRRRLMEVLPQEAQEQLQDYEQALSMRDTFVTKQSYESGFRTAVQMIVAGLTQPAQPDRAA